MDKGTDQIVTDRTDALLAGNWNVQIIIIIIIIIIIKKQKFSLNFYFNNYNITNDTF
jgi:hypothetical protein